MAEALRLATVSCLALALSACAAIGAVDYQQDKAAMFALGQRYENGDGVPIDLRKARRFYRAAAAQSGGTTFVYSPPVGSERVGRVLPLNAGPVQDGLPQAREALDRVNAKLRAQKY